MKILAVDTSTQAMNIAIINDKKQTSFHHIGKIEHSENLIPKIIKLTEEMGLTLKDYDLLVCPKGPGSFTGLRIGMSALKGISVGTNTPLVAVDTNLVLASQVSYFDGTVVPVIDAKKRRFYTALFKDGQRITKDIDTNEEEFIELLTGEERVLFTGPDAQTFYNQLLAKGLLETYPNIKCFIDNGTHDFAITLASLGENEFNLNGASELGFGPTYIRKSDAEVSLENKIKEMNKLT
ncbi:MAG: tRNA (adenosine(37)-N6)-threonylcarbamoyltransferase complex dimerization subunit type 1 TsaB [Spirochaetaceae bacterium]|nr:tRNA (adenosine(37)-N6)-threonylcarbamoyltransferase complex dimerization subunit type 1 TsaB [Spirochaetaceae bacterium]